VTIAHQDDYYEKDYSKFVQRAYKTTNQKAQIIFTDYYEIKNNKKEQSNTNLRIKRFLLLPLRAKYLQNIRFFKRWVLRFGDSISCPAVTFNIQNIKTPLFKSSLDCNVDWYAWEKLSRKKGSFVLIPIKLMGHRIHEDSETSNTINDNRRTDEDYEVLCKFWPKPLAKAIARVYKKSEKNNKTQRK
jgi:hypothetical protein